MSRIGISFWGLCQDFDSHRICSVDTPDGHRYGRPILVREWLRQGHRVIALQKFRGQTEDRFSLNFDSSQMLEYAIGGFGHSKEIANTRDSMETFLGYQPASFCLDEFPDLDIMFIEWRWSTYKNDRNNPKYDPAKYEPDLDRQLEILQHYHGKVPIILWDTDLKITAEDELAWPLAIIADPSLKPRRLTRDRVSLPFWTDWEQLLPTSDPYQVYGYVGNRYEREDEFKRFYYDQAKGLRGLGIQTVMYGNWLQKSPERGDPTDLIREQPDVMFGHRMGFYDSMSMMNKFICTTHVAKQEYYQRGFLSPRYLEALAVNCPALVPHSFFQSTDQMLCRELLGPWVVAEGLDVERHINLLSRLTVVERAEIVDGQRKSLRSMGLFDIMTAVNRIEEIARIRG